MKRSLIYGLGAVTVVAAAFVCLLLNPSVSSRLFFGTAHPPVESDFRHAYDVPKADNRTEAIVLAANRFLDSLDDDQRQAATYRFTDNAQRANWSNFPEGRVSRGGVMLGALSETQRQGPDALLGEHLSD